MYGHNRNSGIHALKCYSEALRKFNTTAPIKGDGRNAGIRPLGHRHNPQFQIRMRDDESIACRLYETDVVVFHKDNVVTIGCEGYDTPTTARFITDVLGVNARLHGNRLVVNVDGGTYIGNNLKLYSTLDGKYCVAEHERATSHTLDRKVMNRLRKETEGYRAFLTGFMKLTEYTLAVEDFEKINLGDRHRLTLDLWRTDATHEMARFKEFMGMVESGEAENWHFSSLWLCASARYSPWDRSFDPRRVMILLDDILIALNPSVLQPKQLDAGVATPDPYARFKPFMEVE